MTTLRLPARDPRTVARDIPGIFDALFPQLAPGVVMHFNREAYAVHGCDEVTPELISGTKLAHAMLFEIAVAAAEQIINDFPLDWDEALDIAVKRQRKHFDARIPAELTDVDTKIARTVATNLARILEHVRTSSFEPAIDCAPRIPGYQWIASGSGDFSIGRRLIEVKCTNKPFSSSDYRQVMMYWLLTYAAAIEGDSPEWSDALLINPRLNKVVEVSFDEVVDVTGAGRSKVDLLGLFSSLVGDHNARMLSQI